MCAIRCRRLVVQLFASAVVLAIVGGVAHAGTDKDDSLDIEKMLIESVYSKFAGTTAFLVGCELSGTAEELKFDQQKTRDRMKLRLANTIANVPIFKDGQTDYDPALLVKPGLVVISIWTVGDSFPVAYHVEIVAGLFRADTRLFTTAVLGYGNSQNVVDSVNDVIDDLIDDFAVAFHKGVGDF